MQYSYKEFLYIVLAIGRAGGTDVQSEPPLATVQASFVIAIFLVGAAALPVAAAAASTDPGPEPSSCVLIDLNGPGVAIDPKCLPSRLPPGTLPAESEGGPGAGIP